MRRFFLIIMSVGAAALCAMAADEPASAGNEFFESKIRPVLVETCYSCHSAKSEKLKGGLRVDGRAELLKGGDNGPVIVPGDPEKSSLIRAIRYVDDDLLMPPKKRLSPQQVKDFEAWVKMGAPDPRTEPAEALKPTIDFAAARKFWSYQPLKKAQAPAVKTAAPSDVDNFLAAKLESRGLTPVKPASKLALIRRATFDLTGLPPTPDEVRAFENDSSPTAFANVIDRLLASSAYGERWGRHWLDVVRYADTAGETADYPVPLAWHYRNYVIDAFNQDKPYDQFIREQIAGDVLAKDGPREKYAERVTATGYLAISRRFGFSEGDFHLTIEDTIDTLGKSILGLSIGCARCHDHKFDPITTSDYYALYGIFSSTRYAFPGNEEKKRTRDMVPLMAPQDIERLMKPVQEALAPLEAELKKVEAEKAALEKEGKDRAAKPAPVLASGAFENGGKQDFSKGTGAAALEKIAVKAGDMIQLTVLPKANHGADSTTVELDITEILEADGPARTWNLARDVVPDLLDGGKGNPHRDGQGNAGVWFFFDSLDGGKMLSKGVDNSAKTKGLYAWQNAEDTPAVFVNTNETELKVSTVTLQPRSIAIHPSPKGGVTVAWQSPLDLTVSISGRVIDADASGGDGIAWEIRHGPGFGKYLLAQQKIAATVAEARKRRDEVAAKTPVIDKTYAVCEGECKNAKIQKRGDPLKLGDEVPRRFIEVLGGQTMPAGSSGSGRLELAGWLTDPANPLTARVMVNRIWQYHFGRGIVRTPNDFGKRGAAPTHPELLDYLTTRFIESGWSIKQMHRMLMLTQAYQRGSDDNAQNAAKDVDNECLWRFNPRRLEAEEIRDSILAVSGELDRAPGQVHPFPPEESWGFTQHNPYFGVYDHNKRGIYLMTQRIKRHPFLALFDGADPNASTPERRLTIVPTQALFFMNDPFVFAKATRFAERLSGASKDNSARLESAYQTMFGRAPNSIEREQATKFFAAYSTELPRAGVGADKADVAAWTAYLRVLFSSNEFIHLD